MTYKVIIKKPAERDLRKLSKPDAAKILEKLEALQEDLHGDVKKLRDHHPPYRLRSGNFRVLFEVSGSEIHVYRILNRRDAYK